ncbi:MAG: putative lipid II flippase FtsW [Candidatus Binatia bacterium]
MSAAAFVRSGGGAASAATFVRRKGASTGAAPDARASWSADARREPIVLQPGYSDFLLGTGTALLVILGLVMVLNTSYFYAQERFGDPYLFTRKHVLSIALGAAALVFARQVPTRVWRRLAYPLLLVALAAVAAVLVPGIGVVRGGARRWLELGGLTLQPSEVAKLAVVLYLAHSLTKKGERVRNLSTGYLPHLAVVGSLGALVALEPDFGTAVLLGALLFLMLVANGARVSHLLTTGGIAALAVAFGAVLSEYRWQRLVSFLDPWQDAQRSGFQLVQSLLAFGAGGLTGVGLGSGRQKMHYLPEAHTDFVFAVIGEELGLAGTLGVVAIFALIAVGGYRLIRRHPDPFAGNLAFGLTSILLLQAVVNMAVAVGLLPTKGLALPFLSYGGSALLVNLTEIGILLGIAREAR